MIQTHDHAWSYQCCLHSKPWLLIPKVWMGHLLENATFLPAKKEQTLHEQVSLSFLNITNLLLKKYFEITGSDILKWIYSHTQHYEEHPPRIHIPNMRCGYSLEDHILNIKELIDKVSKVDLFYMVLETLPSSIRPNMKQKAFLEFYCQQPDDKREIPWKLELSTLSKTLRGWGKEY